MSAGTFAPEAPDNRSSGPANPALNPSAFERGWSLAAPDERVGMTVGGTYIKTGLLIVVLGVLNLPLNYEFIRGAADVGSPKFMEWYGAHGLLLALIWMYIAILRLLAILQR